MMQKKPVHPVQYKSVTSRARTMETRSIAPQSTPVKWGRITPQGGFTLIEILIAMTIFSTSFLALAAGATTVMKSNHTSYNSTIATNMAQDKLEELMAEATLTGCAPSYSCSDTPDSGSSVTFSRSWEIKDDDPVPGVTRINVLITWTDQNAHSLTVSTAVDL